MNDEHPLDANGTGAGDDDRLDELLSADLDGELEAAAAALGLDLREAAELVDTASARARRRTLAEARALLAEPVALDELLAVRLRAKAVRAAHDARDARDAHARSRRTRVLGAIAGVAAVGVVVAGVVAALHADGNGSQAKSSSSDAPLATAPRSRVSTTAPVLHAGPGPVPAPGNPLGAFSDRHLLAQSAVAQSLLAGEASTPTAGGEVATSAPPAADAPSYRLQQPEKSVEQSKGTTASGALADRAAASCPAAVAGAPGDVPVLRTTATLSGTPVLVLVYAQGSVHTVVLEDLSCRLLGVDMLG